MKKIFYLVLTFVLSFSMMIALASCSGDDENQNGNDDGDPSAGDNKVTYTVTAEDEEGNPVKGVKVVFTMDNGTPVPFTTDASGKIVQKTAKKVIAKLDSIPSGYTSAMVGKQLTFDADGNVKIVLTAEEEKLMTVKVVDQNGNAVEGVTVQICDAAGTCRIPQDTDENGEAFYPAEDGTFYASLTDGLAALPEGYTVADPEAKYYFDGDVVIITVEKTN